MAYVHGKSIIKIAFADDSQLVHDTIPPIIDSIENCKIVVRAYNGNELLDGLRQKPDTNLVITDLQMPGMDGIEAARRIRDELPEIKILIISLYVNELSYCRVIQSGANGFVFKESAAEIKRAVFEVMKSGLYFPRNFLTLKRHYVNGSNGSGNKVHSISDEEITFLKLACTEKTYTAIANEMKTSIRHIDYIRERLFVKFNVRSRVELALFAHNGGLIT